MKTFLRNALPARLQVPVKYYYGLARGDMEPEMALLAPLLRRGDHVADIGGNRGTYAYRLWKLGARVEIFEPNPDCADVLGKWAAGRPRLAVHAVALSSRSGTASLHVPVDDRGVEHDASASIEPHPGQRVRDHDVPLRPLDDYGFGDLAFIKIDVEGHESSVIEGAGETLRRCRPALLVEIEQRHVAEPIGRIFERIAAFGYRGFFLLGGRLTPLAEFDPARHQAIEAFEAHGGDYHNNFLFLDGAKLDAGEYRALDRWMAR